MNNLDTQTVKGIVGENFISSKRQLLYKDGKRTEEVDGIKVTIYEAKTQQDIIQLKSLERWKM